MTQKILLLLLFVSTYSIGNAQYFSWGTEPTSIMWRQIQTDNFQVIYPKGQDSIAQRFTNLLEHVYESCGKTLGHAPAKISVVLHTNSAITNGSVAWAPKRMDIFDVVPQDQISLEWLESLAIHEYRHVVQFDKLNQGLTKILYFLLGEQAVGGVGGLFLPSWFFEGDAVATETALSKSGRGRQPEFSMGLRAQLIEKKKYTYAKAYFGSYKHYVPNHYEMGYVVVANARDTFGADLWDKTVTRVARKPHTIKPFNKALKIETKLNKRYLYFNMFEKQLIQWKLEYDREIHKSYDTLTKRNPKEYTNYMHPQRISDTYVVAEKRGLGDASKIVLISKEGTEKIIAQTSFKQSNERFHTNGEFLVWAEANQHIRWELKGSSDIFIYSFASGKTKRVKTGLRVFSPCISTLGDKIVAVEIDAHSMYSLVVFNSATKKVIARYPSPNQEYILSPTWNLDATKIVYIGTSSKGKRLIEFNTKTGERTVIIDYTHDDLQTPIYWQDFIVYSSSYSGVDNIYAIHTQTREIVRISVAKFGARYPSIYHNVLLYSDYTSDGYMIAQVPADVRSWHSIDVVRKAKYELAENISIQEPLKPDFANMKDSVYASKHYSKLLHTINIHSWMPFYMEYNGNQVSDQGLGFQIQSQDKLGTTLTTAGYRQSMNNSRRAGFVKVQYIGLFPTFELDYQNGYQEFTRLFISGLDTTKVKALYHLSHIAGGVSIPLNFSTRSYHRLLTLSGQIIYAAYSKISVDNMDYDANFKEFFDIGIMAYTASFANVLQTSIRDVVPRMGQMVQVGFGHAPLNASEIYHDYAFGSAKLYVPGILKHHSIELYGGYEWNADTTFYTIQSFISMPRGYLSEPYIRKNMISAHINYTFPVWYPDFAWVSLLYVKRFHATVFVDYARMDIANADTELVSFGLECIANFNMLHIQIPGNFGPRVSILPQKNLLSFELVAAMDISGM